MRKGLFPTTNDQPPSGPVEPKKLNRITSGVPDEEAEKAGGPKGVIPFATPKPEGWQPKGDGFAKMITTHDEPDKVAVKVDEPIDMGADNASAHEQETPDGLNVAAPSHKKYMRKKKA